MNRTTIQGDAASSMLNVRKHVIRFLLAALNSRWLNRSPCRYGFIGNVDAFDISNLRSEVGQRADLTVAKLIEEAERFASCPVGKGLTVIEDGCEPREATIWDAHELKQALTPKDRA